MMEVGRRVVVSPYPGAERLADQVEVLRRAETVVTRAPETVLGELHGRGAIAPD